MMMKNGKNIDRETGIWSREIAARRHKTDGHLAAEIWAVYGMAGARTVADLGCGLGAYCAIVQALGAETVVGYEGTRDAAGFGVFDMIVEADLTKRIEPVELFDLVLCLEVAEHVPRKHEAALIGNVARFARRWLVMSWAPPGQYSASGHVNPRSAEYVVRRMRDEGFEVDGERTKRLRAAAKLLWLKTNVFAMERR